MGPRTPPSRSGHSETAGRGRRPGERFHYSDLGYQTLGLVIEAVEGRPYPEAVRTRVLEPLRMTATEPAIIHDIRPRLAVGYAYLHDDRIGYPGRPLAPATWVETATADGAIASTAGDIAALARMLLRRGEGPDGRLLSEASFARMAKPHARSMTGYGYGYGLATRVLGGRTFLGHGGGMIGYLSALQVDPAAELAAVILQNGLMGSPMARTRGACQAALTLLPASIVKVSRAEGLRVSGGCGVCDEWPGGANPRCLRQRHPRRGPGTGDRGLRRGGRRGRRARRRCRRPVAPPGGIDSASIFDSEYRGRRFAYAPNECGVRQVALSAPACRRPSL